MDYFADGLVWVSHQAQTDLISAMEALHGDNEVKINSIVELISRVAPQVIEKLREQFPENRGELQRGLRLGTARRENEGFLITVADEGLKVASLQIALLLRVIPRRLSRAKQWKLASSMISAFTSAGVVTAAFAGAHVVTIIGGLLAFISSLCSLLAQHIETPLFGSSGGLAEVVESLLRAETVLFGLKLEIATAQDDGAANVTEIVRSLNAISSDIRRAQIQCGVA